MVAGGGDATSVYTAILTPIRSDWTFSKPFRPFCSCLSEATDPLPPRHISEASWEPDAATDVIYSTGQTSRGMCSGPLSPPSSPARVAASLEKPGMPCCGPVRGGIIVTVSAERASLCALTHSGTSSSPVTDGDGGPGRRSSRAGRAGKGSPADSRSVLCTEASRGSLTVPLHHGGSQPFTAQR